tara:strand:- start:2727 stop:3560 length:834 start_codon:yes stop_codon:yes gene_type:complete
MKKVLLNVIGTPRIYMSENAESIMNSIIKINENYEYHIVIHTSDIYTPSKKRENVNKKRTLQYASKKDLHEQILNEYSKLSKNIDIFIEPLYFDIGLPNYDNMSFMYYLRIARIYNLIENINDYDIIINCRNDIIFEGNLFLNNKYNNIHSIIGKKGGFRGYANGDFDCCLLFNAENYHRYNKCINHIFTFNNTNNTFYKTTNLKYILPKFDVKYSLVDNNYYKYLEQEYNKQINNKSIEKTVCGLGEIFLNYFTKFDMIWDIKSIKDINTVILFPK